MKHYEKLTLNILINEIKIGDYFTYKTDAGFYRKGLKITASIMIPIGTIQKTLIAARKIQS